MTIIAVDARYLMAYPSGVGRYTTCLLRELFELASNDVSWCIVRNPVNRKSLEKPQGARVTEVYLKLRKLLLDYAFGAERFLDACSTVGTPDLVHGLFHQLPYGVPQAFPTIVSLMDVIPIDHPIASQPSLLDGAIMYGFGQFAVRRTLQGAVRVLPISEASRVAAERHFGPLPCDVVELGVEEKFFERTHTPIAPRKPYVVVVGNSKQYKNVDVVLRAFLDPALRAVLDLVLIGPGEALRRQADAMGAPAETPGFISEERYLSLLRGATASVFPSLVEGFGLPPLEAMACGIPTLVTSIDPMRALCAPGAQVFEPHDHADLSARLQRLAKDPDWHSEQSYAAEKRAEKYQWRATADATLQVYERVLGRSLR